jgi:hypothetical protein
MTASSVQAPVLRQLGGSNAYPSRQQPATDVVGALNQLNATLRGLKALLNERLVAPPANDPTNDVY